MQDYEGDTEESSAPSRIKRSTYDIHVKSKERNREFLLEIRVKGNKVKTVLPTKK